MARKTTVSPGIAQTTDPVELHILSHLEKLRIMNRRFRKHIQETGRWVHMKDLKTWKAYDFYNYFTHKFSEKYRQEFKLLGSEVRTYKRIETFLTQYGLTNEEYKNFIDLMFSRYFNSYIRPAIGHLCSDSLYIRVTGKSAKRKINPDDLFKLDQRIAQESAQFENEIQDTGAVVYGNQRRVG